jgi:hypothetical protein
MMATTIEACLAGNPRRSFWHFQTSYFDFVSCIGIVMEKIIQLAYFRDEKFTLMDAKKLCPKDFLMKVWVPRSLLLHPNLISSVVGSYLMYMLLIHPLRLRLCVNITKL